jgi:hypothetical protein
LPSWSSSRLSLLLAALAAAPAAAQTAAELAEQRAEFDAVARKTIVELQPLRHEMAATVEGTEREIRLIDLNPGIHEWFLLTTTERGNALNYHIENPDPEGQRIALEGTVVPAITIASDTGTARCAPWEGDPQPIIEAERSGLPFAPICGGRLYLRNRVTGASTSLERTTDFLRDKVWGGEELVRFVRDNFYKDRYAETSEVLGTADGEGALQGPPPAPLSVPDAERPVIYVQHEFGLDGAEPGRMTMGVWYPVSDLDGVFVSTIQPRYISQAILDGPGTVNWLDGVERSAVNYFVAFDLSQFEIGFSKGTDHPRVDWSPRPPWNMRVQGLPGPDGIGNVYPVVPLGMVSPEVVDRTIATFTAGYKRSHGAFKWGPFSQTNYGTHYGFLEHGTLYSRLWPGLSTLYVLKDGTIGMKTWTEEDNALLPELRFARQNGVPLVEYDAEAGMPLPGPLVTQWGPGNWSGSAAAELRTLRAGGCIVPSGDTRYLIYGYFSTATPSVMARTFQAYGCEYAMLLDMNALEHTYLALYVRREGQIHVEHMVPGMALVDRRDRRGNLSPRFIAYPDNRDLFYVMRKEETQ